MKTRPCLILACLAFSSSLMADEPFLHAIPDLDETEVDERMAELAKTNSGNGVSRLSEMEVNDETIESILQNKEDQTDAPSMNAPIVIRSMEDAAKHLKRASMEKLDFDFDRIQLVIFAWKGSDMDKLQGYLRRGKELEADFRYIPASLPPGHHPDDIFGPKVVSTKAKPDRRITQSAIFLMTKDTVIRVRQLAAPFGRVIVCE